MTYVNPIPANYDSATITVEPNDLNTAATALYNMVHDISDYLAAISTALQGLTLSWSGSGATQAQQYQEEWNYVVQLLFGVGVPSSLSGKGWAVSGQGALTTLVSGVSQAVSNYDQNEAAVAAMFNAFANGFSSSADSSQAAPQPDQPSDPIDGGSQYLYHTTAVNESF